MVDVELEVATFEGHEANNGGGFRGRFNVVGLERVVDKTRGFGIGLAFGGEFGVAAGGAFGNDVEEGAGSAFPESVERCRHGCLDQGSEEENPNE